MNDETNEKEISDGQIYAAVSRKYSPEVRAKIDEMHSKIDAFLDKLAQKQDPVVTGSPDEIWVDFDTLGAVVALCDGNPEPAVKYIRADIVAEKDAMLDRAREILKRFAKDHGFDIDEWLK